MAKEIATSIQTTIEIVKILDAEREKLSDEDKILFDEAIQELAEYRQEQSLITFLTDTGGCRTAECYAAYVKWKNGEDSVDINPSLSTGGGTGASLIVGANYNVSYGKNKYGDICENRAICGSIGPQADMHVEANLATISTQPMSEGESTSYGIVNKEATGLGLSNSTKLNSEGAIENTTSLLYGVGVGTAFEICFNETECEHKSK